MGFVAVLRVTTVNDEGGCGGTAGSAAPGGGGAGAAPVGLAADAARWEPGAGSEVAAAASGTSARGALLLPPLARRPPPAAPRPPRLAGPGRRRRGHVALGPAAAGRCLCASTSGSLARGLSGLGGGKGRRRGPARPGRGPLARPQRDGRGGRSRRSPAQPGARLACEPWLLGRRGAAASCPALPGSPLLLAAVGRPRSRAESRAGLASRTPEQTRRGRGKRLAFPASSNLGHVLSEAEGKNLSAAPSCHCFSINVTFYCCVDHQG